MIRFVAQYGFWLTIFVSILNSLSDSLTEFQIFRYAGF